MTALNDGAAFLGRVLLAAIFVLRGLQKLADFAGTGGYIQSEGLPFPTLATIIAIVVECVGGILLIVGYQTRLVGIGLAAWCIVTAYCAPPERWSTF